MVRTPSKIAEISRTPRDFKTPTTKLDLSPILTQTATTGNLHSDEDADMENNFKGFHSARKYSAGTKKQSFQKNYESDDQAIFTRNKSEGNFSDKSQDSYILRHSKRNKVQREAVSLLKRAKALSNIEEEQLACNNLMARIDEMYVIFRRLR